MTPASGLADGLAIDVHELVKRYGTRTVVDRVSLAVEPGRICGFLGPNGSGKTTTLRMICGLLTPDGGSGTCLGHDLVREREAIKRQTGYMTQRFGLYEDLTIRENLEFVGRVYDLDRLKERVDRSLDQLGLATRQQQLAGALSGGWKQRLALAACVLHEPRLLLLDEPTAGMGDQETYAITRLIRDLHRDQNLAIVLIEHDMRVVFHLADRIMVLAEGAMLAEGVPADIAANEAVQAAYLGKAA